MRERRQVGRASGARAIGVQEWPVPLWAWALVAGGLVAAMPTWGQGRGEDTAGRQAQAQAPSVGVPGAARPRSDMPTLPRGNDGMVLPPPRSEDPQVTGPGHPVPDHGVIAPPQAGVTPVIPPPGSAGGDRRVVPK